MKISIYTDGSFKQKFTRHAAGWGYVIFDEGGFILQQDSGYTMECVDARQIAGECIAPVKAIRWCIDNGYWKDDITIYHDYLGISKWALREWRTNKPVSKYYVEDMEELIIEMQALRLDFTKVPITFEHVRGHVGIEGNELADELAAKGLLTFDREEFQNEFNQRTKLSHCSRYRETCK